MKQKIIIIGAGASGLFCAQQLLSKGFEVDLYDQMSGVGKKFLVAGNGGLNLTHSEDTDGFSTHYGKDQGYFKELLNDFSPNDTRGWYEALGVETFIGSSGRVFPVKLKAAETLKKWITYLRSFKEFNLHLKHRFESLTINKELNFICDAERIKIKGDVIIFALGGASWARTGSDGKWKDTLESVGVKINDFAPMNCGFERVWTDHFKTNVDRAPLKNIAVSIQNNIVKGEVMLTPFGIEGGAIYALSNIIRDTIAKESSAKIKIDLKPDLLIDEIVKRLQAKKDKVSMSNYLRKSFGFSKVESILLRELDDSVRWNEPSYLANLIKNLELVVNKARPIDEAISTSGGVCFSQLSNELEYKEIAGVYFVGEMLDFEAPTGGYLLQGCFSTGARVVRSITKNTSF